MERREFLQAGAATLVAGTAATSMAQRTPARKPGQKSVADLVVPKMERIRVGFIGTGARGSGHVSHWCVLEGTEIVALCDTHKPSLEANAKKVVDKYKRPAPKTYGKDPSDYKRMLAENKLDAVVISTPWEDHTPMAVAAMEAGAHALIEVPAATTVEDCWKLVNTAERTQKNCMMLENVCYGREELLVLNMAFNGVFGELLHGEAAYIHDLRWQMKEIEHGTGSWRTLEYTKRNGNLYPTHGLGPIAQYMGINRGDNFDYMVSMGTPSLARGIYAKKEFPEGHPRRKLKFVCNDLNTSIIKTKRGRTIMLQWDEQLPRPYTRHNLLQGTDGCFAGFPNRYATQLDGRNSESWLSKAELDKEYAKYEHPLWKRMGEEAQRNGGHGGMDFLMWWRVVYCLRNGLPLDQDVYDAAAWSVVGPLSETSLANRAATMTIPDFTRGEWKSRKMLDNMSNA